MTTFFNHFGESAARNKKWIIHLDMDGVITDLYTKWIYMAGGKNPEFYCKKGRMTLPISFVSCLDTFNIDFWENLYPYTGALSFYEKLANDERFTVIVLTASNNSGYAATGKIKWLKHKFGDKFNSYVITEHKYLLSNNRSILIDDHNTKVKEYIKYGGSGIVFPRIWNSGYTMSKQILEDPYSYTYNEVIKIVEGNK